MFGLIRYLQAIVQLEGVDQIVPEKEEQPEPLRQIHISRDALRGNWSQTWGRDFSLQEKDYTHSGNRTKGSAKHRKQKFKRKFYVLEDERVEVV